MEMPGSAPGVWKRRWQYCPMRTRRLCGLTLVVLAAARDRLAARRRRPAGFRAARAPACTALALVECAAGRDARSRGGVAGAEAAPAAGRAPRPAAHADRARRVRAARARGRRRRAAPRAPPDAATWPVYPTRPPPSTTLRYALVQGGAAPALGRRRAPSSNGAATTRAFSLRARHPRRRPAAARMAKHGRVRRGRRRAAAARRAREAAATGARSASTATRGVVRFSGASGAPGGRAAARRIAGAGSRSWRPIAEAGARHGRPPARWDLQVAGLRGELERWTFRVLPPGDPPPELAAAR